MKIRFHLLLLVIICTLTYSCNKDSMNELSNNSSQAYYPNTIGSFWKYQRIDSIANSIDTITISIKSSVLINGRKYKVWTYEKANTVFDTAFIYTSKDSVIISASSYFYSPKVLLIPFRINEKWSSSGMPRDTSDVLGTTVINNFETFKLTRQVFGIDVSLYDVEWIAPYIGIIREDISEFSINKSMKESWKLLTYSVK